ncbi:TetR/AcrR family transcriptional regulator [Jeotgalicoccus sp. S0W5]|uniref:TetR/AcrR family transcriptional regulator n=1 Tax=Jeotgalicoccus sp. S0W5 TaxID=2527874 RepID=UPI0014152C6F|nr:TetR/AcrR family transcriptional regulator [Jeotgalicoccus sp. S0W5]
MNRRQKKTRQAIIDACFDLMKSKDLHHITINDIAEKADINRGTFYLHFEDKYDMMKQFENEMIEKLEDVFRKNLPTEDFKQEFLPSRYDTLIQVLRCYEENQKLMQLILQSNYINSFEKKLQDKMLFIVEGEFSEHLQRMHYDIPKEVLVVVFTSIFIGLVKYSYTSEDELDIEKTADYIFKIVLQGPAKVMGFYES